jgi:putative ABC transport system ATP-binding protein
MEPLISIKDLRVIYNQGKSNEIRALEETNLEIYPEEYVIIFGPSGCGKSTLMYSIAGLQKPTYGDVAIEGKWFSQMNKREMLSLHQDIIGLVFQAFYLIPSLSVLANVCLPRVFRGERKTSREEEGVKSLRRFSIVEQADKYPSQLSGGQKQRVAIARALINNPKIVLADEPVGNLDSESARNVLQIMKELNEVDKQTIIMVTHNPEHLAYADRVIHMRDGRVIKEEVNKEKRPVEASEKKLPTIADESPESKELNLLMSSFKSLLPQQVDVLLVPFKAKQLLSHLLSELSEEQISMAETLVREVLFRNIDIEEMTRRLDLSYEKGGGDWNKTRAETLTRRVREILDQVNFIRNNPAESARSFTEYLVRRFHIQLDEEQRTRLRAVLAARIESKIGQAETLKRLDLSFSKGGVGLYRQTAERISREVEIVMLLKYS